MNKRVRRQHRNKHQNCCRIVHIETGMSAVGTASKERIKNQRDAFIALSKKVVKVLMPRVERDLETKVIRNYNESRNEVHDKKSGLKMPYKTIMNGIGPMNRMLNHIALALLCFAIAWEIFQHIPDDVVFRVGCWVMNYFKGV